MIIDRLSKKKATQQADNQKFAELDGATFEMTLYMATHSTACFRVTGLPGGYADLCFHSIALVDCPTKMRGVILRIADVNEAERKRELASESLARDLRKSKLYLLSAREGRYSIWAEDASFDWNGKLVVWMRDQCVDDVVAMVFRLPLNN